MILGSIITSIITPFADLFGRVLAFFYSFTHSYGLSITLLTLAVMILVFPLTRAGTRSMMRMQILSPELKKIQAKYKTQPGMSAEERQQNRLKLNEEMMALYRENGVNPTGGCLPMFLQFPIFIVLYNVIRGMTRVVTTGTGKHIKHIISPQYIPTNSNLYRAVIHSHGVLSFLGLNLTDSVRSPGSFAHRIPYILIILIAVVLQYISIWQITTRNPAAQQANPQMQAMQKFMPLIFVVFYIVLPAGVGVYFIVSSLFRIGQQEYMYKHDPKVRESIQEIHKRRSIDATAKVKGEAAKQSAGGGRKAGTAGALPAASLTDGTAAGPRKSFRDRLRDARAGFAGEVGSGAPGSPARSSGSGSGTSGSGGSGGGGASKPTKPEGSSTSSNGTGRPRANGAQPGKTSGVPNINRNRSRDKRPRRP
jgi:YidC/Oxa1 family membrane protein insertase